MKMSFLVKKILPPKILSSGFIVFNIALFLLPSSAFLSGIFFLIAVVISSSQRNDSYWSDYWNYPLLLIGLLMVIGSFDAYSGKLALFGLANWIPFFWCFWGFKPYLLTSQLRKECSLWLLAGTLPVICTGLGQMCLGWEGPWQILDGLIVWFVAPGGNPIGRLSGLFDYANIAGAWLAAIWPFSLAALLQPFLGMKNRFFLFLFSVLIVIALLMTQSRNAWGGLIIAIPFVLGMNSWIWLLPLMFCFALPILWAVMPSMNMELQEWSRNIVPNDIWMRLNDMAFADSRPIETTRIYQWQIAIDLISQKPWFGWGAAAFSLIYPLRTGIWHGHAHNLPLDVATNHGLLVAFILNIFVFCLLIGSILNGLFAYSINTVEMLQTQLFDRAWWAATFILVCFHATDMPLYDSRINMIGWILLVGLRCTFIFPKAQTNLEVKR